MSIIFFWWKTRLKHLCPSIMGVIWELLAMLGASLFRRLKLLAQAKAAEDGHPLSVIVRRLLRAYVSGEVQITMELRKEDGDG